MAVYKHGVGESAEALQLAESAQAVSLTRKNQFVIGEAIQVEAEVFWSLGKSDQAIDRFRKAAASYSENGRHYRLGLVLSRLGDVLYLTGCLEEARTEMRRAVALLVDSPDRIALAQARENLADVLNATGDYSYAIEHLVRAAEIYQALGNHLNQAIALAETCLASYLSNKLPEASTYLDRALSVFAKVGIHESSKFHEVSARIYIELGKLAQAEVAVRLALESAGASGTALEKAKAERTAGRFYILRERYCEAILALTSALDHARNANHRLLELEIKALLALAHTSTDPREASGLLIEVEAEIGDLPLPQITAICIEGRNRIETLCERFFVISDRELPTLGEARSQMTTWLWKQTIHHAKGDTRQAAAMMGVTTTYIRKLGNRIKDGRSPTKVAQKKRYKKPKRQTSSS